MMNLIITCARHLEEDTGEELRDILDELGDSEIEVSISDMSGILTAQTKLDPIEVVKKNERDVTGSTLEHKILPQNNPHSKSN
ncbi:hypothetical protein OAL59_04700 [Nitrosopumilus sp.]|nr:hypothetical protein [Nitrosopumilus sp.]